MPCRDFSCAPKETMRLQKDGGEVLRSPLSAFILDHPYSVSIHLIASESFTLPKYLWVVDKSACRNITLLTISIGVPDREAYVAA